ncbi:MAG: 2-oxoacid:acceptor oxidoreductase subunit alpha [Candidatus Krumholzibacteria bacterium]|nr:2-oxoacid:acceptor oxidoreductase subunit alpha [Candidatus Krumholzibacteria bacterium]
MKSEKAVQVIIGGEAGQGLATVGRLLSLILVRLGYRIVVTQSYMSRIRGGHNTFAIRVSPGEIAAPVEPIDVLVALTPETVDLHRGDLTEDGLIVGDASFVEKRKGCAAVPFGEIAREQHVNTAAVGLLCSVLGIGLDMAEALVDETFKKKNEQVIEENLAALRGGYEWAEQREEIHRPLPAPRRREKRLMMSGNEAIALGALSAGVRLCAFYPMTPSTSIPLTLISAAGEAGVVVEQAEDEIAAINMAIGASYAGAPAMVATSGGGFALMIEGVSLAAMTETPVVVVVAQRPGPATGLPTRTEQADLEMVLYAGHGEFPRAIFAPGDVEECFYLARQAFETAEHYQGPVFVLTDQFLADSARAVKPFPVEELEQVRPGADPDSVKTPYRRYEITGDGISPRLLPGASDHLVVAGSDEHTEDGHLTEDLGARLRLADKRLRKGLGLSRETIAPSYAGDAEPEVLLVCWGSVKGAALEAAGRLRDSGTAAAVLHFSQVWPLDPGRFLDRLRGPARVIAVEGNATGQLARLIHRESGFEIPERIHRYDGLPITPGYILRSMEG